MGQQNRGLFLPSFPLSLFVVLILFVSSFDVEERNGHCNAMCLWCLKGYSSNWNLLSCCNYLGFLCVFGLQIARDSSSMQSPSRNPKRLSPPKSKGFSAASKAPLTKENLLTHIHLPSRCTTYRTTIRRIIQKTAILLHGG
jgi:hypothetical protein